MNLAPNEEILISPAPERLRVKTELISARFTLQVPAKRSARIPSRGTILALLLLTALAVLVSWPLLIHGMPDLSNDGVDHARYDSNFAAQFWGGELYPRWLTNVNGGLGGASLYFYPPLQSFVASLFWPALHSKDPWGWLISGYSCALASVLAGLAAFAWLRSLSDNRSAAFGAAVYMLAPYHVAIDLYNRGAAAEYWVFVWLPLIMLASHAIVRNSRYALPGLIASFALCVYSHPTVAVCCGALPIAFTLAFSEPTKRWRSVLSVVFALALGVGMAAVFLLPALLDQSKTWVALQTADWGDYRNWWLFQIRDKITEAGTQGAGIPWYISYKMRVLVITLWTLLFSGASCWLIYRRPVSPRVRRQTGFYAAVAVTAFFLMLRQSDVVWRIVPVLKMMQFPHRLSTFLVLAEAALACFAFRSLTGKNTRGTSAFLVLSILGWGAADAVSARQAFSPWRYIPSERAERAAGLLRTQQEYISFWPRPARVMDYLSIPQLEKFIAQHTPKTARLTGAAASGSALVESWNPRTVSLSVNAPAEGQLILNYFYMEGWRGRLAGESRDLPLRPSSPEGLITISVPAGRYRLTVDLPPDPAEQTGKWISLASLMMLAVIALWKAQSYRIFARAALICDETCASVIAAWRGRWLVKTSR